jgi:hypothetical protein
VTEFHEFSEADLQSGEKILFEDRRAHREGSWSTGTTLLLTNTRIIYLDQGRAGRTSVGPGVGVLDFIPLERITKLWVTDQGPTVKERFVTLVSGSLRSLWIEAGGSTFRFLVQDPEGWVTRIRGLHPIQEPLKDTSSTEAGGGPHR